MQKSAVCPKCAMLYAYEACRDAYCPVCGWEYATALRATTHLPSRRERRIQRRLFPVDLSAESFFLGGCEYSYRSIRDIVFWFTARPALLLPRAALVNPYRHHYLLAFRAGRQTKMLRRIEPAGGPQAVLATAEAYLLQVYRTISAKSFGNRVAAHTAEMERYGHTTFGAFVLTKDRTFELGRHTGALAAYQWQLRGSTLWASADHAKRASMGVSTRKIPDLDVALAIIRALLPAPANTAVAPLPFDTPRR